MARKKKITIWLMLPCFILLFADEKPERSVYFPPETPYITKIVPLLEEHDYVFSTDTLNARYRGELFFYVEKDSIRCEVELSRPGGVSFILGAFMTEPPAKENVQHALLRFSIWMLILNAVSAILFFVRSS